MRVWILFAASLVALTSLSAIVVVAQATPIRVDTDVVLKQLVKKVPPNVPRIAEAAQVGGMVMIDIVIGVKGTVEEARIVFSPSALLDGAAIESVRKWEFKPILVNGKPVRALALVEVEFPKPVREQTAIARGTSDGWLKKVEELVAAGNERMSAKDIPGALSRFEEALELMRQNGPGNMDFGFLHAIIGYLHMQALAFDKADASLTTALTVFDSIIKENPDLRKMFLDELDQFFENYASVKRIRGDMKAAAALEARRLALQPPPHPPPAPPRMFGNTPCFGDQCAKLPDSSLSQAIRALPKGAAGWLMFAGDADHVPTLIPGPAITVYLQPSVDTPEIRRGRIVMLIQRPASGKTEWELFPGESEWAQVPAGRRPSELFSSNDTDWPFSVSDTFGPAPTNDEIRAIVATIRVAGDRTRQLEKPNVMTDVQPWPIASLNATRVTGRVDVELRDPVLRRPPQPLTLERQGADWKIVAVGRFQR